MRGGGKNGIWREGELRMTRGMSGEKGGKNEKI